jgi:hypothetical protein
MYVHIPILTPNGESSTSLFLLISTINHFFGVKKQGIGIRSHYANQFCLPHALIFVKFKFCYSFILKDRTIRFVLQDAIMTLC